MPVNPPKPYRFTIAELSYSAKAIELRISNAPPPKVIPALERTIVGLEGIRGYLGHPIHVTSGYRCEDLNAKLGGEPDSQHLKGEAADFTCAGFGTPITIVTTLRPLMTELGIDQLILEPTWVHVSFSAKPRGEILTRLTTRKGYAKGIVINA